MVRNWLAYASCFLCALAFFFLSPGYLSFFLLAALAFLPLLSLLLILPSYFGTRLEGYADPAAVPRGASAQVRFAARRRGRTVQGAVILWRVENLLFPQFTAAGKSMEVTLPTDHCGWVKCTVRRCFIQDWMGLFRLPIRAPQPILALVRPIEDPTGLPNPERAQAPLLVPRPGGGPGEDYELRDYLPGDPVTAIHWKLTAKRPEDRDPILRETLEPAPETIVVSYDHFGPPDRVDTALDRLDTLARRLLDEGRPFVLAFHDPATGAQTPYDVRAIPDWEKCLERLCAHPAPLAGQESVPGVLPGRAGPVRRLRVTGVKGGDEG